VVPMIPVQLDRIQSILQYRRELELAHNPGGCVLAPVMHLGYDNPHASYVMDGNRLQVVSEERDLGVIMSKDLKWEKQCVAAVKHGNKILGMIKRNFTDRSEETIQRRTLCAGCSHGIEQQQQLLLQQQC